MEKNLLIESGGVLMRPALAEEAGEKNGKWTASVWKLGEMNLNGRIYTRGLAERIVSENKKTVAYDGHDVNWTTGEEYGIAKAVCSNPRIEGNELRVDIYFIDEAYKARLEKLVDMGISIGVSSVGYGDVDPTTGIVNEQTYVLIRFLDFVTMPAGDVYARMGEKARNPRQRLSVEAMAKAGAEKAMAERRSKVAEGLAKLLIRR